MKTGTNQLIRGIVFDMDGTLVDSMSATFDAFNHGITAQGGKRHTASELLKHFGPGEHDVFYAVLGSHEKAAAAYEVAQNFLDNNIDRYPLFDGVVELLDGLDKAGIPFSVFTGRSWSTTEMILKHHRLIDRFVTVVASDHVDNPKPSPEGLLLALSRMNIHPDHAVLVGDSWTDIQAAKAARCRAGAALWDILVRREDLDAFHPDYFLENPADILNLLAQR